MSAETSRDVSLIQDEDVLRKMWQDTEDFGRKKEIRTHMYKLREARLRDFYNSGEVSTQTKQTSSTIRESTSKGSDLSTHADSLADHSFLSLKSKEIRDSESPTRDVSYKISGNPRLNDQGWNVVSSNETSPDGKTHTTMKKATTSGTEKIDGGVANYAAKTEQKATVFRDGDDKNFTKAVGAASQSEIKQEASGGDENSKFYTSSTSKTSSSKYTSEQRSTSGDIESVPRHVQTYATDINSTSGNQDFESTTKDASRYVTERRSTSGDATYTSAPTRTETSVVRKVYTTDAPNEFKNHPSYVDGNTKVITETKTLPDGSLVTTTRYETKGSKTASSSSHAYSTSSKHVSSTEQKSSTSNVNKTESHKTIKDSRNYDDGDNVRITKYVTPEVDSQIIKTRLDNTSSNNVDQNFSSTTSSTRSVKVIKNDQIISDSKTVDTNIEKSNVVDNRDIQRINDLKLIGRDDYTTKNDTRTVERIRDEKRTSIQENVIDKNAINRRNDDVQQITRQEVNIIPIHPTETSQTIVTKTTVVENLGTKYDNQKVVSDDFINVERQHVVDTKSAPQPKLIEPDRPRQTETVTYIVESARPSEPSTPMSEYQPTPTRPKAKEPTKYETPEKREPIKPGKSELDVKSTPTEGQYDTTYRTDYTNRRISVEVSPTHDAFARSLRAASPDRPSRTGSTRSLRTTSTTSLRSSTSPDKYPLDRRHPNRASPDRYRPTSPTKKSPTSRTSPDKYSSTETVTKTTNRFDAPGRKSPEKHYNSDTITRSKKNDAIINTTIFRNVPDRRTPDRKPSRTESLDTITRRQKTTDDTSKTVTRKYDTESIDSSTLTRRTTKKNTTVAPRSRSVSPTSTASDIEYLRSTDIVTDLDDVTVTTTNRRDTKDTTDILVTEKRPSSLDIVTTTTKKTRKVTERSPTSPLTDITPKKQTSSPVRDDRSKPKEVPKQINRKSPTKEPESPSEKPPKYFTVSPKADKPKDKVFKRTDTYEERCRQILGIPEKKPTEKTDRFTTRPKSPEKKPPSPSYSPTKDSPRKPSLPDAARRPSKSPEKLTSPTKIQEFPSQVRKSPEKQPLDKFPEKTKPRKESPTIHEFPSQIRKSPQKEPMAVFPEKPKTIKEGPKVQEFPSQIRKSPEKEYYEPLPEKTKPRKESPIIQEFPSQIRKLPQKEPMAVFPEKPKTIKEGPNVQEFPSQIRKSPEKEYYEPLPEKPKPTKQAPTVQEFPSQIRKSPEKEVLEKLPEKSKPTKQGPTVQEFPSQIRKSPEKQPLEVPEEKQKLPKQPPKINEFPSQIRKSPEKVSLENLPDTPKQRSDAPTVQELPSQTRRSPERVSLVNLPDRPKEPENYLDDSYIETKRQQTDTRVDTQFVDTSVKRTRDDNILISRSTIPDKKSPVKTGDRKKISNSFIENERTDTDITLRKYNVDTTKTTSKKRKDLKTTTTTQQNEDSETTTDDELSEEQVTITETTETSVKEFPSQTRKSPVKGPLEPYPEKQKPSKYEPKIQEFPSQIRRTPEKEPLEQYPEKTKPTSFVPKIQEFPSQSKKSPEKETLQPYPEKSKPSKEAPQVNEFPSQVRKIPQKDQLEPYPEKTKPTKDAPTVQEFPSQTRKSPEKAALEPYPEKSKPSKEAPQVNEFPSQVRRIPQKEQLEPYPEKVKPTKDAPTVQEFPSQIRKSPQREPIESHSVQTKPVGNTPKGPSPQTDEIITSTKTTLLETRVPVDETVATKKFISTLCREEEVDRNATYTESKQPSPARMEPVRGIPSDGTPTPNKTVKKDLASKKVLNDKPADRKKVTEKLIDNERVDTDVTLTKTRKDTIKTTPRTVIKSPDRSSIKRTTVTKQINGDAKFNGETEYTDEYCRTTKDRKFKQVPTDRTTNVTTRITATRKQPTTIKKTVLRNVETMSDSEEEKTTLIKTQRTDTTKTYTTKLFNGDAGKTPYKTPKPKDAQKAPDAKKLFPSRDSPSYKRPVSPGKRSEEYRPKTKQPLKEFPSQRRPDSKTIENDKNIYNTQVKRTITKTTEIKPSRPVTKTVQKTIELQPTTKRHVVSTIINISPKTKPITITATKPIHKTSMSQTITSTKTTKVSPRITVTARNAKPSRRPNLLQNGQLPGDETEESDIEVLEETYVTETDRNLRKTRTDTTERKEKVTRTTSDQVIKSPRKTPVRGMSKPEFDSVRPTEPTDKKQKPEKKCITTKSILIQNAVADEREIIVHLKRSKSSREGTPDRICPFPVQATEDFDIPRYPDQITEPEEVGERTKPKRLSDIPLTESEDVTEFSRLTDVTDNKDRRTKTVTEVDRVQGSDECLLTVNEKVTKFLNTAEQLTKKPSEKAKPVPKVDRPRQETNLEDDECLLSVSDKVNKFITTAEQIKTNEIPLQPKTPRYESVTETNVDENDESRLSISEKVSHFITTAERVKQPAKPVEGIAPKIQRPDLSNVDENIRSDECLLSVSDKVNKFITTADRLTSTEIKKPISLSKMDSVDKKVDQTRRSPSPKKVTTVPTDVTEYTTIQTDEEMYTRRSTSPKKSPTRETPRYGSPDSKRHETSPSRKVGSPKYHTPERRPSDLYERRTTEETTRTTRRESFEPDSTPKTSRRSSQDEPKTILSPTGRLRSTETIKKAKALFENINKEQEILKQRDIISRPSVFQGRKLKTPAGEDTSRQPLTDRNIKDVRTKLTYGNEDELIKKFSKTYQRTDDIENATTFVTNETRTTVSSNKPREPYDGDIPHYMTPLDRTSLTKPTSEDDSLPTRLVDSDTRNRYENEDELIKKFTKTYQRTADIENATTFVTNESRTTVSSNKPREPYDGDIPHYMTPLDRTSLTKPTSEDDNVPTRLADSDTRRSRPRSRDSSPGKELPHYMTPLDRTLKEKPTRQLDEHYSPEDDFDRSRDPSPEGDVPHYMMPLDRTIRTKSPHYETVKQLEETMIRSTGSIQSDEVDTRTTKFGVTLRRTDSGRVVTTHRKSSTTFAEKPSVDIEIEDIYDLEVLEEMLERVVGYDIRRRIRAQIRIVKRLIEEDKLETVVIKKTTKTTSPTREPVRRSGKSPEKTTTKPTDRQSTEYQTTYTRKISPTRKAADNKLYQHTELTKDTSEKTTEYQSSYSSYKDRRTSSEITTERRSVSPDTKKRNFSPESKRSLSPDKEPKTASRLSPDRKASKTETTRVFQAELKKTKPVSKTEVSNDKPEWVTQRNLRKITETSAPVRKVTTTTTTTKKTIKKEPRSSSPPKESRPTDVITSSYGIGPMDENGSPLFGLKALRAQNKSEKTKVQGTVIRSHYYAENGEEPVGEISVTKYSTDPNDLGTEQLSKEKGIASVTTTQKFGYKGTPPLKTISNKKKQITDVEDETRTTTRTSKVSRRGSVKEISQKFIENAVDTLKSERQSSYPKAGLILRTSSFRDTASSGTGSSREASPGLQEVEKSVTTVKTSTTSSSGKADTFLTNKSRVTGVQDVITRMKNEDVEIGESLEDIEARNLLNKFIGSQVLLSGMEGNVSRPTSTVKRIVTKVTTTTDGGEPKTVTRTFTHPITAELLETVWDEQTLKLLLEQSTDYEDRRIIRARLRQVMAEQEACAELVEKASEECVKKEPGSIQERVETTHRTFSEGPVTTTQVTSRVTSQQQLSKKPMSPFAKFRQLDKQNSLNSPPSTPKTPTGGGPLFKFTDPALCRSASTVKERLLQWCQMKTKEYENIQIDNFSTSWADGLAFCALIHHFLPDAFDYHALNPKNRRHNFTLAFQVADEKVDIAPLLDVDDMVATRKPDWKCVFTYVQSVYRRFKDED